MDNSFNDSLFVRILVVTWKRRRLLLKIFAAALVLSIIVAWIWPKDYTTECTFQIKSKEKSSLSSQLTKGLKMLDPGGSSDNAGVSTVMAIFESRQLAVEMIQKFGLMKKYRTKWIHLAIKQFQKNLSVQAFSEGIIHMEFTDGSQDSVKLIADSILAYVDAQSRELSTSKARMDYQFLNDQVEGLQKDISGIGDSIIQLLKKYNMADFKSQMELGLGELANLDQQLTKLSSEQKLMETENSGPLIKIKQVRNVIAYLQNKQKQILQGKPVTVSGTNFTFTAPYDTIPHLAKAFKEMDGLILKDEAFLQMLLPRVAENRVNMVENTPSLTFIDPTFRPSYKSAPKRVIVILLVLFPIMLVSYCGILLWEFLRGSEYESDAGRKLLRFVASKGG
jgi:tyrosine-protein kinase Etk/Wzc